ncbi:MAG: hypothetical protein R3E74_13610 [Pseudomonadales bacterium]
MPSYKKHTNAMVLLHSSCFRLMVVSVWKLIEEGAAEDMVLKTT